MKQNRHAWQWAGAILSLVIFLLPMLVGPTATSQSQPPLADQDDASTQVFVVRLYFDDQEHLNAVAGELDIWHVDTKAGYALAAVSPETYRWLAGSGYRVNIDLMQTVRASIQAPLDSRFYYFDDDYTNPNGLYMLDFMQETNTNYAGIAELIDIGDAWQGDNGGYLRDILVLRLTNEDPTFGNIEEKPAFYLFSGIHAREVAIPELVIRYIKYLTTGYNGEGGYGLDPDATWLLNHNVIYILVSQNPDGHRVNEANTDEYRRKNMNNDACAGGNFGVDLNRNHSFMWNCCGGSSGDPCNETYRGPSRNSEPETQAFQTHFALVMLDQNGSNGDDELPPAAPDDATGIFISLHSYSDLTLFPWGFDGHGNAPNHDQLESIAHKFAYYTGYTNFDIYGVDGVTDDWTYGKFGVSSFTFEVGPTPGGDCGGFFPSYECMEGTDGASRNFWAENKPAFIYAHKIARTPYMTAYGPDAQDLAAIPGAVAPGDQVDFGAVIADQRCCGDTLYPIAAAEYFVDAPGDDGTGAAMTVSDGGWDETNEDVQTVIDTTGWALGQHYVLVHGQNNQGDWGPFTAVFIYIIDPQVAPLLEGYVRDITTNAPLDAAVSAGTAFAANTNPATGYYSMTVVSDTYNMSAVAAGYAISTVTGVQAHDYQTIQQDFFLYPICDIFTDDVESGNQGWTAEGDWAITDENSHSPSSSWTDSPGGNYGNNWNYSLTSPIFDLSDYENVNLSFWHIYDLENGYDYGYLEYSTNGGGSWTQAAVYNGEGQTTWMQAEVDLSALDGQAQARIRFRIDTDGIDTHDGWHIDDVVLFVFGSGCGSPAVAPTAEFTSSSPVPLGQPMDFTNLTVGTQPMDYAWDFGDGVGASAIRDPQYTYTSTGTFTVTLAATNTLGSDSVSHAVLVEVDVCTPLDSVDISGPASGLVDTPYTFVGSYSPPTATLPITYTWSPVPTSGQGTANGEYNWAAPGWYTITLSAANQCSLVTGSHSILISESQTCQEITSLNLTLLTTGTIYVGDMVDLSADVMPDDADKPYSYTVDYDDSSPPVTGSSSADPLALSHTFAVTGAFTVQLEAWNCEMAAPVSSTLELTVYEPGVCVDLAEINIAGDVSGYPGVYTFTTSYTPPSATYPINYLWDDGGQDGYSVRNLGQGVHTLLVTATNCSDALVTGTHQIVIEAEPSCVEIAQVDISTTTPGTIYTDTLVGFSVNVTPNDADKPYSYTVDYGEGAPIVSANSSADPLSLTHTFTDVGTYDVTIEAWNCEMAQPETDQVTVIVREQGVCVDLSEIAITGPDMGMPNTYTFGTRYEPTDASLPIAYLWNNGNDTPHSTRYLDVGVYTLAVTATNCTSASVNASHVITIAEPDIEASGPETGDPVPPDTVYTDTLDIGNTGDYTLTWTLSEVEPIAWLTEAITQGETAAHASTNVELTFDAAGLIDDVYTGTLIIESNDPDESSVHIPVTLTVAAPEYTLTTGVEPLGRGSVTLDPAGGSYPAGTVLTLTAQAVNAAWQFSRWTGDVISGSVSASETITMDDNYSITAHFVVSDCIKLDGIELTLLTTDTVQVGVELDFRAAFSPNNFTAPYTYTVLVEGGSAIVPALDSENPLNFTYTFETSGAQTVEIRAWNCEMTQPISDSVKVDVQTTGYHIYLPVVIKNG